ncbi:hypothetical protein [Streptomyces atratus]|uniref:hypothetical protein n=1 Tax=Streptomyces atratus TaxID=1893 RepID=UPI00210B38EB|nr:hypothetical protein [Streptomyces atratus]
MNDNEESEDLKGGPGHIVLPAVVFAVPVLKLVWTLGGGGEASEALVAMEPSKLVVGAFHGLWWGVTVALVSYVLRLDVIVEYRTGSAAAAGAPAPHPPADSNAARTPRGWPPCCRPGWCFP